MVPIILALSTLLHMVVTAHRPRDIQYPIITLKWEWSNLILLAGDKASRTLGKNSALVSPCIMKKSIRGLYPGLELAPRSTVATQKVSSTFSTTSFHPPAGSTIHSSHQARIRSPRLRNADFNLGKSSLRFASPAAKRGSLSICAIMVNADSPKRGCRGRAGSNCRRVERKDSLEDPPNAAVTGLLRALK